MDIDVRVIPEWPLMIITLISVLVLYLILRHFLHEPVSKFMRERKENIQNDIDSAKGLKEEAISLKENYELKISDAKKEGQEIVEASRKRGEEIKQDIIDDAKEEAENIVARAKREIRMEKEKAIEDMKIQAGDMAILIASRIIDENMNEKIQADTINKFIDEVGMDKWQS